MRPLAVPSALRPPRALGSDAYRLLWVTMVCANGARWAYTMLASYLAYLLTHSAVWVGLTMFALQMPAIALSLASGVLADRMPRSRLLGLAIGVSLVAAAAGTMLLAEHRLTAPWLVALSFVLGIGTTVQSTAQNTLLPRTVPAPALFEAVALQGTARQGAEFFGPALATPVLALFGRSAALAVVAVLFGLGLVAATALARHEPEAAPFVGRPRPLEMLAGGIRYVRTSAALLPTLVVVALHCLLTMAYMGILPSLATAGGIDGMAMYGGLMTTAGVGAIVGTLLVAGAGRRLHPGRLLWALSLLSGVGVAGLGIVRGALPLEAAVFLAGGATATFMAVAVVRIQRATTDEAMRGRVMSLYLMLAGGAMALGNWGYGALTAFVPLHAIPILSGGLFVAIVLAAPSLLGSVRAIYAEPLPMPLPVAGEAVPAS